MENASWNNSNLYNQFMGLWSIKVAQLFLNLLNEKYRIQEKSWIDVGCGTGALTFEIMKYAKPEMIVGVDPSKDFLPKENTNKLLSFKIGSSDNLPIESGNFDFAVSALALNFMPNKDQCIKEMLRVLKNEGVLALYVWDYSEQMEFLRYFWDTAIELIPGAEEYDQGEKFPICRREALKELFEKHALQTIDLKDLTIQTEFKNFQDYWKPFLGGQGSAGRYMSTLEEKKKNLIKNTLFERLPIAKDGKILLKARAFAISGNKFSNND